MISIIKRIRFSRHAYRRLEIRSMMFNIFMHDAMQRSLETVRCGAISRTKHSSEGCKVYCRYFSDNLSFYVVCDESYIDGIADVNIRIVMICEGRE